MLTKLFSFSGRMGRLAFVGWTAVALILALLAMLPVLAVGAVLELGLGVTFFGPGATGIGSALAATAVLLWTGLALAAKRVRDTGFDPLMLIGAIVAFLTFDGMILTQFTDVRLFWPFDRQTLLGGFLNAGFMLFLLLWPAGEQGLEPDVGERAGPARSRKAPPRRAFGLRP